MSDPLIKLENAGVYYRGGRPKGTDASHAPWALRGLNLEIRRGEKLGIVGRNGCGKSTLLRLLAGIISPDEGRVRFADTDVHVQLLALGVGFEGALSGAENAILSGLFMGKSRRHMEQRLNEIQDFSELGDAFHAPVNTYSSGMNARLGFSIALQTDPDVFLIDEVLGVGDHAFQVKSQAAVREKFREDKTVVLISHEARTIGQMCNRAVWMNRGDILADGAPEEVCERYEKSITPAAPTDLLCGDGSARIERAWLEDADGREISQIEGGLLFRFCCVFVFHTEVDEPVLGFKITTAQGVVVAAGNTQDFRLKTGRKSAGEHVTVRWNFRLPLTEGVVFFSTGCSHGPGDRFLCRQTDILKAAVTGSRHQRGLVSVFDHDAEAVTLSPPGR